MGWRLALGVALVGSLALACATEKQSEDGELLAEQRPGDGQGPAAEPPGSGAEPPAGGGSGDSGPGGTSGGGRVGAGVAPWAPPRGDCKPQTPSIYYTGILLDMTTGEATCSRQILVCGDSVRTDRRYNFNRGERCPWGGERAAIASREDGMPVCCDEWEKAKLSKSPCDPLADADCDGIPNDDDPETLNTAPLGAR